MPAPITGDVRRVLAYKRDLLFYDHICLCFESDVEALEVSEDATGWRELLDRLPALLPGASDPHAVCAAVVQPPFPANETVVFLHPSR